MLMLSGSMQILLSFSRTPGPISRRILSPLSASSSIPEENLWLVGIMDPVPRKMSLGSSYSLRDRISTHGLSTRYEGRLPTRFTSAGGMDSARSDFSPTAGDARPLLSSLATLSIKLR